MSCVHRFSNWRVTSSRDCVIRESTSDTSRRSGDMHYKSLPAHNAACNEIFHRFQDCQNEVMPFEIILCMCMCICTRFPIASVLAASVPKISGLL